MKPMLLAIALLALFFTGCSDPGRAKPAETEQGKGVEEAEREKAADDARIAEAKKVGEQIQEREAKLQEAFVIAQTFAKAIANDDGGAAYSLLSKEYQNRIPAKVLQITRHKPVGPQDWVSLFVKLQTKVLNQAGTQATFQGDMQKGDWSTDFQIVLILEPQSKLWRVASFTSKWVTIQ